jgi:hypothetical protein
MSSYFLAACFVGEEQASVIDIVVRHAGATVRPGWGEDSRSPACRS